MHKRLFGLLASGAILVAACGGAQQSSAPSATTGSSAQPSASTSGAPTAEQTLTMVMDGDVSGGLSNAADNVPTAEAIQFLYDAIYRYDNTLTPQPNLSESLADVSDDGKVWTIKLKPGLKFHDGTDLTSADVVQSYQLAASPNCRYNPSICLTGFTTGIEAVDDLTVKFTLKDPLSTFATIYLSAIGIESKDAIDASYQKYLAGTKQLTAAAVKTVLDAVDAETKTPTGPAGTDGKATVNWDALIPQMEQLITSAGQTLPDKATFVDADGKPDPAAYGAELQKRVAAINETFVADQIDALAAAYPYLDFQKNPVGSGPFKFVNYKSGESLEYAANPDYHFGAPKISKLFIPIIKDDLAGGQALVAGQVDWKYSLEGATYNQIKDDPNLKFVEYPDFGFFGVYFNMHPDAHALFADKNLRQAVAYCFDKVETVKAATEGQGVPVLFRHPARLMGLPGVGPERVRVRSGQGHAAHRGIRLDEGLRRHLREGRQEAGDRRRRSCRSAEPFRIHAAPGRPGEDELRDGHHVQGSRLHRDLDDARQLPAHQRGGSSNRRSRTTRTSAGSAPASTRIHTASITARSARRPRTPRRSTTSATRTPRSTSSSSEASGSSTRPSEQRSTRSMRSSRPRICPSCTAGPTSPARVFRRPSTRPASFRWTPRPGSGRSRS